MLLKPSPIEAVPEETARIARAAFRKGNPLLRLRDEFGAIFADADFADLSPSPGSPGWRRGGWPWSPCCNSARISLTGRPPRRCALGSTGSTPSGWS